MASLIQRRMAIERRRTSGVLGLVAGGIFAVLAIAQLMISSGSGEAAVAVAIYAVIALMWLSFGLMTLRRFRREIASFTAVNGPEAGKR